MMDGADYCIQNGDLYAVLDSNGNSVRICEAVELDTISIDLLDKTQKVTIRFQKNRDTIVTPPIPREVVMKRPISELSKYGLTAVDNSMGNQIVAEVLNNSEAQAIISYVHRRLGFANDTCGWQYFLANRSILLHSTTSQAVISYYERPEVVAPCGDIEGWRSGVEALIIPSCHMQLALSLSALAPVAYLLRETRIINDLPVIGIVGKSSTGKTAALRVIASVYGSTEESGGLIGDMNTTIAGLFATFEQNQGFPMILDEATYRSDVDFSTLIYQLSKGMEKKRSTTNGGLRERRQFSGAFFLSSETSLLTDSDMDTGAAARYVELSFPWTSNADHAEQIEETFRRNYGTAVYMLIPWLWTNREKLADRYREELDTLRTGIAGDDNIKKRRAKIYAQILVSAWVVNQAFELQIDIPTIRNLLTAETETSPAEIPLVKRVYNHILEQVAANGGRFARETTQEGDISSYRENVWGTFSERDGKPCVWIAKERFEALLREAGVRNQIEALRELAAEELIRYANRHYAVPRKLGKVKVLCYCLYLEADTSPKLISPQPPVRGTSISLSHLLARTEPEVTQ